MDRASAVVLTLAFVLVGVAVTGGLSRARTPVEHRVVDRDVPLAGAPRLLVRSRALDVSVVSAPAAPGAPAAHLHVDLRGVNLAALETRVGRDGSSEVIDLREHVPGTATSWLSSGKATLTLRAPVDVTVSTSSGDVGAQQPPGALAVHTTSGDVTIDDAQADIDAGTTSGDVRIGLADGFHGKAISVATASGDVSLRVPNGFGAAVHTHTVSGSVAEDAHVVDASQPVLQLSTTSGDIHISAR